MKALSNYFLSSSLLTAPNDVGDIGHCGQTRNAAEWGSWCRRREAALGFKLKIITSSTLIEASDQCSKFFMWCKSLILGINHLCNMRLYFLNFLHCCPQCPSSPASMNSICWAAIKKYDVNFGEVNHRIITWWRRVKAINMFKKCRTCHADNHLIISLPPNCLLRTDIYFDHEFILSMQVMIKGTKYKVNMQNYTCNWKTKVLTIKPAQNGALNAITICIQSEL